MPLAFFCSGYIGMMVSLFTQAGLDCNPLILNFQSAGMTGVHHCAQLFPIA
jgi:hypothetical protein